MKPNKPVYWITTILVAAAMAFDAYAYLTHEPKMSAAMASLGYPGYFQIILGIAKLLGVLALLLPRMPILKEWAYAGFTFTFLGAAWSHASSAQNSMVVMPLIVLLLLVASYLTRPLDRRIVLVPVVPVASL